MSKYHTETIWQLPSLRALYIFEAAARHLNLVRAADELGLTQGALSRQIRLLEDHVGVPLFVWLPRGLAFTEAGDILRNHCQHAFRELQEGIGTISGVRRRQSLVVAIARSYATRILSHRVASFVNLYPWIDLVLDGHRHLVDLAQNEADVAIRVGDGQAGPMLPGKRSRTIRCFRWTTRFGQQSWHERSGAVGGGSPAATLHRAAVLGNVVPGHRHSDAAQAAQRAMLRVRYDA